MNRADRGVRLLLGAMALAIGLIGCGTKPEPMRPPEATGEVVVDLAAHWTLRQPGSALSVDAAALGRPLIVVHGADSIFRAFDSFCPHQGCQVAPRAAGDGLECPCHVSRFAYDGSVTEGPAPVGLTRYAVTRRGDTLRVNLSRRVGD